MAYPLRSRRNKHILLVEPETISTTNTEQIPVPSNPSIDWLNTKINDVKKEKRLTLLKNYLDNNVKYDDEEYTTLSDLRKKFKEYCYDLDKKNLNNMSYNLSKEDIINYDNRSATRYKIKYYSFCKSCNQRYRQGCCDENNRLNRSSKEIILYMKLRNL